MTIAERGAGPRHTLYRRILRPFLFRLDPERAHEAVAALLRFAAKTPGGRAGGRFLFDYRSARLEQTVAGLRFAAPVGLAAGLDKSGELYPVLAHAGFGFVEVGTFTRRPQEGNPGPRLFRFAVERALVNRMGFNNPGAEAAARTLERFAGRHPVPLGVSVGRSRSAASDEAVEDQAETIRRLEPWADYLALNVSSPNTPGLRAQQQAGALALLVAAARQVSPRKPLFLKLAPDFSDHDFDALVEAAAEMPIAGLILTNTTLARDDVPAAAGVEGGLSGAPLFARSTALVRRAFRRVGDRLAIIGVGGVFDGPGALAKIRAGASLVQVYTGYVFEGPGLPRRIHRFLDGVCRAENCSLGDLVGSDAGRERI